MRRAGKPARWAVYLLRKKASRLGTVDAVDEREALDKAAAEFEIEEKDRFRVSVKPE